MTGDHLFKEPADMEEIRRAARTYRSKTRMLPMCDVCGAQGGVQVQEGGKSYCVPTCLDLRKRAEDGDGLASSRSSSRPDVYDYFESQAILALVQAAHDVDRLIKKIGGK